MNQNFNPLQPVNPQTNQPYAQQQVVAPSQPVPHVVVASNVNALSPHMDYVPPAKKNDRAFYLIIFVLICLIVGLGTYVGASLLTSNNSQVNNIPVSEDDIIIPEFVGKTFELNQKVIWKVSYPETFFVDETEIEKGKVTLTGEYIDNDMKVIMSFPEFKDYANGIPFSLADWLKAEKAFASESSQNFIRTELLQVNGLESAIVYNYPEIIEETETRTLGISNTIVLYIWKNENSNPRRVVFEMDNFNETFLNEFVQDFILDLEFQ